MRTPDLALRLSIVLLLSVGSVSRSIAADVVRLQTVQFSEASFDKSNFEQLTVTSARQKCEEQLNGWLDILETATELSKSQKEKMTLAGRLDIHRFFYDYQLSKQGMKFGSIDRNEWQAQFVAAQKKILPLKTQFSQGLHGRSSLFFKTLTSELDDGQQERVRAAILQRERGLYRRYIQGTLGLVDRKFPLSVDERTRIIELLLEKTDPPQSYGASIMTVYEVLSRMDAIRDDLRAMFSDQELAVMEQLIQAGKQRVDQQAIRP